MTRQLDSGKSSKEVATPLEPITSDLKDVDESLLQTKANLGEVMTANEEIELSPEQIQKALSILRNRFRNDGLPNGWWPKFENALMEDKEALWSTLMMENAGHEPMILPHVMMPATFETRSGFYIATGSEESPESGRNCVYNKRAQSLVKNKCNGNAVDMAKSMRIDLMPYRHYIDLHNFTVRYRPNCPKRRFKLDTKTSCYLYTDPEDIKSDKSANTGYMGVVGAAGFAIDFTSHGDNLGWRGERFVNWDEDRFAYNA